ncbi:MAG: hypothetical protein AMJ69_08585 [Gammaproteobacteria bacterium SG8_47]|nr:MAG: hypothetical protein AMJ69_08585 [Gammaproteobacteria bacterium SG8_47]
MWQEIVVALGLVMVIEGLMPSLSPRNFRQALLMGAQLQDATLRKLGLASMIAGAVLIYVVR